MSFGCHMATVGHLVLTEKEWPYSEVCTIEAAKTKSDNPHQVRKYDP